MQIAAGLGGKQMQIAACHRLQRQSEAATYTSIHAHLRTHLFFAFYVHDAHILLRTDLLRHTKAFINLQRAQAFIYEQNNCTRHLSCRTKSAARRNSGRHPSRQLLPVTLNFSFCERWDSLLMWVALNSWYPDDGGFLGSPSNLIFFHDDDARADAPVSCAAIRHASVNGEHAKTHEAKRCARLARDLAQRSTGRSLRGAEHRFSRLLINNAALLMATKSPLRRAQTGNGRPH